MIQIIQINQHSNSLAIQITVGSLVSYKSWDHSIKALDILYSSKFWWWEETDEFGKTNVIYQYLFSQIPHSQKWLIVKCLSYCKFTKFSRRNSKMIGLLTKCYSTRILHCTVFNSIGSLNSQSFQSLGSLKLL